MFTEKLISVANRNDATKNLINEENATKLFGSAKTLYSTEGSSHVIRAMLYLAKSYKTITQPEI